MSRCLLVYLAIASFQCHFLSTAGQSNGGDLMYPDEEPQSPPSSSSIGLLRGRTGDQIRNELAMAIAENANWDKMNKLIRLIRSALKEKTKRDDDVPPGFIGVRGRRSRREFEDIIQSLLNGDRTSNLLMIPGPKGQMKKSDSNAYKDGFLGVRG